MNKYKWIDLQLFAQDSSKTEKATPKKKDDARKKGQVLQSKDFSSAIVLLFIFVSLKIFASSIYGDLSVFTKEVLGEYYKNVEIYSFVGLSNLFMHILIIILKTVGPIFAIAMICGLLVGYAQVGFLFTTETLGMKFSRINPLNGLKRVFSTQGLAELLKSSVKIAIVSYVAYSYFKGEANNILSLIDMDVMSISIYIGTISINIAIRICIVLIILAIFDYIYQWWEFEKSLKMSKEEIKEEYKQVEGNPEIKSQIKQKQRQISMRRMLSDVPKADVIITNPTHFAVALKYDAKISDAPMVIAKGQDFTALRIKEVAKENGVEIVENKPLARSLYETTDIGDKVPPELYQAVAEVLAFVYSLKEKGRTG